MRLLCVVALLPLAAIGYSQSDLIGLNKFTETREMSGMSGGCFGVLPDGTPNIKGAMAISTPIAYSLDHWHWAAGINSTSPSMRFTGLDLRPHGSSSSGTGEIMTGIPAGFGAFTLSIMPIDVHLRYAMNLQFTPRQSGMVRFGAGVQDIFNDTRTFRPRERRQSRSYYLVGTANPTAGGFVSLGFGTQRFGGVFGNVSQSFGNWKAVAEYDTYNWNYGVANGLGHRFGNATLFAGFIRGKYATVSAVFSF